MPGKCSMEFCGKAAYCRGWCVGHYYRWKRSGSPEFARPGCGRGMTVEDVLLKIGAPSASGCWPWDAFRTKEGYGRVQFKGRNVLAHRFVYELFVGPIPGDLVIDHLCRVRHCVNPDHMEPVTLQENIRRGYRDRGFAQCQ